MPDYADNTKIAIVGVIAMGIISIFKPIGPEALEVIKLIAVGLLGFMARGKES